MKIRQLQAMRALVRTGTTTEAAQLLHMTQPAVSKLISQIEEEFNVSIFDRRQGRLVMTPEGMTIYADVERILSQVDELVAKTKDSGALSGNAIRIGAMPALGYGLIPSALQQFSVLYPHVRCVVDIETRGKIEDLVSVGHYDLGFVTLPVQQERLELAPLTSVDAVCILPPGHVLAQKSTILASDLARESFVSLDPNVSLRHRVDAIFGGLRINRRLNVQVSSSVLACQMAAAGLGVSIVHPLVAMAFRSLVLVRKFQPAIVLDYAIVSRPGSPSRAASTFQAVASDEMKKLIGLLVNQSAS